MGCPTDVLERRRDSPFFAEELLHGNFNGKTLITVKVHEVDGEKKLFFEASGEAPAELVGASGGGEEKK